MLRTTRSQRLAQEHCATDRDLRVEAHLPRFARLIDITSSARRLVAPRNGQPGARGWTEIEARLRQVLLTEVGVGPTRSILAQLTERHGTDLHPLEPLGLTRTNVDYHTLSNRDWTRSGLPPRLLAPVTFAIASALHPPPA